MSTVWETRWRTLETLLSALAKQYHYAAQTDPWMRTMYILIVRLKLFGRNQFQLYHNDPFTSESEPPILYQPREHLMHAMISQITYDMSLFQKATGQRRQAHLQKSLAKADQLAQHTLNQAVKSDVLKGKRAVTYFDQSADMRILSYAPIILIALPDESISTALFWQMVLDLECPQMKANHYRPDCDCKTYCHS